MQTISDVLTPEQLERVHGVLRAGPWTDGQETVNPSFAGTKQNEQLVRIGSEATEVDHMIVEALTRNDLFRSAARPRRFLPPLYSRYRDGMEYSRHIDTPFTGAGTPLRTDLAVTLFLSEPESYDGGELVVETPAGEVEFKLACGSAVVYSGATYHRVEPVTRGERLAAVTWVQSFVRDAALREVLLDLEVALARMHAADPHSEAVSLLARSHANLLRMFAEN